MYNPTILIPNKFSEDNSARVKMVLDNNQNVSKTTNISTYSTNNLDALAYVFLYVLIALLVIKVIEILYLVYKVHQKSLKKRYNANSNNCNI